jgi:hypothetical protein
MGYRSDVKIVFYLTHGCTDDPDPDPLLPFAALKFWFDETYPVQEAKDDWGVEIEYGSNYILCSYQDVKWYEGYQHPNNVSTAFEKFSNAFRSDERDHRAQYEFVRIGEEYDDIQLDSSSYADHRIAIERSIIFE